MRTRIIVGLSVCILVVCATASGEGLQKISEHVYAYVTPGAPAPSEGVTANAGLVVGKDSALVIDTLFSAKAAERFLADVRKITDKPIKYAVNTHFHFDHAWGNSTFVKEGATVVAHEKAESNMAQSADWLAHPEQFGLTAGQLEGTAVVHPAKTFADRLSLDLGDVTVELVYSGPTHTNDSITALISQDNVLFTGDLLFTQCHPFLAHGDMANWPKALNALAETTTATIIPGHGPISSKTDLADMSAYVQAFDKLACEQCVGKRPEDAFAIAVELVKALPQQQRSELSFMMIVMNIQMRYLTQPDAAK